ncbi:MAG: hypothetical protein AABW80_00860 [Nanoarchaeota archaeon]
MGGYQTFNDDKYGLSSNYGNPISNYIPTSQISLALDARTANQLKQISEKMSSGAKAAEIQLALPDVADSIPDSHLEEINRLRKLVGAELTLHGVLVDPTGVNDQGRWDPTKREQAERHMWQSVDRAHKVNPEGNVVVTFHTSNGLPEPETYEWDAKEKKEKLMRLAVIDERSGEISALAAPRKNILEKPEEKYPDANEELSRINRELWTRSLSEVNQGLTRAKEILRKEVFSDLEASEGRLVRRKMTEEDKSDLMKLYKLSADDSDKFKKTLSDMPKGVAEDLKERMEEIGQVDIFIRNAYTQFKESYSQAYEVADREKRDNDKKLLETIGEDIRKSLDPEKGYLKDKENLVKFADVLSDGVEKMNNMKEIKLYRPLKEFAIDQASTTFANLATKAYEKYKSTAPIIAIENPPAGMGISRAGDMVKIIEAARSKFSDQMVKEGKMSEHQAKQEAEKLIGATWDVGHINMIRKYGYGDKELLKETEKIAPYVKNIHLSDNFGMMHTELPMGMGNVPMKGHIEKLKEAHGEALKKIKQVIETGNWYQHFQTSPFAETLSAFGSPIYSKSFAPYWNQAKDAGVSQGYFSGYGMNPDIHHSIYGAGFSNLPVELGGQVPSSRNRFSGAPME